MAAERLRQRLATSPTLRELARRLPSSIREALKGRGGGTPSPTSARRARAARIILMYHRVASAQADPLELCVAPSLFRDHVSLLQTLGEVVPLATLARPVRSRSGVRFAITFDDGYADNALAAQPLLEAGGAPATVFVVAGSVGAKRPFWWDRLASLVFERARRPQLELTLNGQTLSLDVGSPAGRRRTYWTVWSRLRMLAAAEIEEVLEDLEHALGSSARHPDARAVTEVELRSLAEGGVEIGAHTLSHPSLPAGTSEEQRREIEGSRSLLEQMVERPVTAFAYPYGDYDSTTVRLVKELGFDTACTVQEGRVWALSSRFLLPRYPVRNWPAEELERRLHGWIHGA